jgi:hypothetical protein
MSSFFGLAGVWKREACGSGDAEDEDGGNCEKEGTGFFTEDFCVDELEGGRNRLDGLGVCGPSVLSGTYAGCYDCSTLSDIIFALPAR